MWTYHQASGELWLDDELVATGYSGFGDGKNNPALEDVVGVGPIPQGFYRIGAPEDVAVPGPHGPFVLPLTPRADDALSGRDGFLIHGDAAAHPGCASHGCIVVGRGARERLAVSGDPWLEVVRDAAQ
jgi:Protein of unknown function (DUF2778)